MQITRWQFAICIAAATVALAWGQAYRPKPITCVVKFAADGEVDVVMRNLSPGLQQ